MTWIKTFLTVLWETVIKPMWEIIKIKDIFTISIIGIIGTIIGIYKLIKKLTEVHKIKNMKP